MHGTQFTTLNTRQRHSGRTCAQREARRRTDKQTSHRKPNDPRATRQHLGWHTRMVNAARDQSRWRCGVSCRDAPRTPSIRSVAVSKTDPRASRAASEIRSRRLHGGKQPQTKRDDSARLPWRGSCAGGSGGACTGGRAGPELESLFSSAPMHETNSSSPDVGRTRVVVPGIFPCEIRRTMAPAALESRRIVGGGPVGGFGAVISSVLSRIGSDNSSSGSPAVMPPVLILVLWGLFLEISATTTGSRRFL